METLQSLIQHFGKQHYTLEQKALGLSLLLFAALKVCFDLGIGSVLLKLPKLAMSLISRKPKENGIWLGNFFIRDFDRIRHNQLVGPPGTGKTELTKLLCFEDIKRGRGCFIIDPKGDRELYDEVRGFCHSVGREKDLMFLSATFPEESVLWNPCGLGNASELQSKFLNSNLYTEAHYAKACELGLLEAFNELIRAKPTGFGLNDLVDELHYMAEEKKSTDYAGLFYDFGSLAQSEWAPILGCTPENRPKTEISLLDIVQKNQILFVHLPTEGKSVQSSRVGRLLTQELILISGLRKNFPTLNQSGVFAVYIDEFDAFATESFVTFLNKGRSSHFMIHIAHQTLSDLRRISIEYASQVLGNCNNHFIFRQDNPDDSDFWSRFFGTHTVTKRTYQTQDGMQTGTSSNREAQEFLISPDELRNLKVGQCIASIKTQQIHKKVNVPMPKKYATQSIEASDISKHLKAKQRNLVSVENEKSRSQQVRDLSSKQFDTLIDSNSSSQNSADKPSLKPDSAPKWKVISQNSQDCF